VTLISRDVVKDGGQATRVVAGDVDGGRSTMCLDAQLVASCRRLVRRDLDACLHAISYSSIIPHTAAAAAATATDNAELMLHENTDVTASRYQQWIVRCSYQR